MNKILKLSDESYRVTILKKAIDLRNYVGSAACGGHEDWRSICQCIMPRIIRRSRNDAAKDVDYATDFYSATDVWCFLYFTAYDGSTRRVEAIR